MPDWKRQFLLLLSSTRRQGNSEQLAQAAALSLPAGAGHEWRHLLDYPLPAFVDLRHESSYAPAKKTPFSYSMRRCGPPTWYW